MPEVSVGEPIYCACGCGTELKRHRFPSQQARFVRGHNPHPLLGKHHSEETKAKISAARMSDNPGYGAIHFWLSKHYTKSLVCEDCGRRGKTDWANISGEYHRRRDDFRELCRSCHKKEHGQRRNALGRFC